MDLGLKGKNAIVTGGASGIGLACCKELANEGVNVFIADVNVELAQKTVEELKNQFSVEFYAVKTDVTSRESIQGMVKEVKSIAGHIDVLINSAGVATVSRLLELPDSEWDFVMDLNAKSVFMVTQEVINQMIMDECKGKIVNISSQAGKKHVNLEGHYSASKAAVNMLTQSFAIEVAPYGINVNAVCPGSIASTLNHKVSTARGKILGMTEEEFVQNTIKSTPLGRQGTTEEIAYVVAFLSSNKTDFMTGQCINVTGGRLFN